MSYSLGPLCSMPSHVITNLNTLNPHDFNRLMMLLIGNKTIKVAALTKRINAEGVEEQSETFEERPMKQIWHDLHDNLLSECYLKAVHLKDSSRIIEFSLPYLRRDLKKYIESMQEA